VNLPHHDISKYLTEFKDEDESGLEEELQRINRVCSFTIQTAKAQTIILDPSWDAFATGKTITIKHLVYRTTDKITGLQFDFKAEQNTWHMQKMTWRDFSKPENANSSVGYYSVKATMKRFKEELLDGLGKDFAYGHVGNSGRGEGDADAPGKLPVKRNRFGDWRHKPADIKDETGWRSRGLERLDAFYLRLGLLPMGETVSNLHLNMHQIQNEELQGNTYGMMMYMPSEEFKRSNLTDKQLKEYSKYADNSTKRARADITK
tara:strand:+ start:301 stop:1086 length:786 start_codon:yes stop_codon:yes gene_type:complete